MKIPILLLVLNLLPITPRAMEFNVMILEKDEVKYERLPVIHEQPITSIEGGYNNNIHQTHVAITINEPVTQTLQKRLGRYNIEKEETDIEMGVFNSIFPRTHRTVGTQVSTYTQEPFLHIIRRACIETLPALMVGSLTGIGIFALNYRLFMG